MAAGSQPLLKEEPASERPEGFDRPAFAKAFPRDPALDALVLAFEEGDYARVRAEAPKLARDAEDAAVRSAAAELRKRIEPDPLAYALLAITGALLAFLTGWFLWHGH